MGFEPEQRNFARLRETVGSRGVTVVNGAIRRSDQAPGLLAMEAFDGSDPEANTAAPRLMVNGTGDAQTTWEGLDDAIRRAGRTIRLLKLDCEGAEYPILFTSRLLAERVDQICMEFHPATAKRFGEHPRAFGRRSLVSYLRQQGFFVTFQEQLPDIGYLWAYRRGI